MTRSASLLYVLLAYNVFAGSIVARQRSHESERSPRTASRKDLPLGTDLNQFQGLPKTGLIVLISACSCNDLLLAELSRIARKQSLTVVVVTAEPHNFKGRVPGAELILDHSLDIVRRLNAYYLPRVYRVRDGRLTYIQQSSDMALATAVAEANMRASAPPKEQHP